MKIISILLLLISISVQYKTILHITDIHTDLRYEPGSPTTCLIGDTIGTRCCHKDNILTKPFHNKASVWGDYNCDMPLSTVEAIFKYISSKIKPDIVIWGGDSPGHHVITQTPKENYNAVSNITLLFNRYFSNSTIIPVIGNHDTYPVDQFPTSKYRQKILNLYYDLWDNWLVSYGTNASLTFRYGGYYKVRLNDTLLLIINTEYYDKHNIFIKKSNDTDYAHQLLWLSTELDNISKVNGNAWIIGHIPPDNGEATQYYKDEFVKIINKYSDVVRCQLYGHTHHDDIIMYPNNTGYITPSLQPDHHQGGFRIYITDNNMNILDYNEYIFDLNATIAQQYLVIRDYYSAKSSYNLKDMSYQSWRSFYNKLYYDNDSWDIFYNHYQMNGTYSACYGACKYKFLQKRDI